MQGTTVFYTMTDVEGHFSFSELSPGEWTLSVVTKNLSNKFLFDKPVQAIHLENGTTVEANFMMKDKVRKINFGTKKMNLSTP